MQFQGNKLRSARQQLGLSLDQLVLKIDKKLSKQSISRYEKGEVTPTENNLKLLATVLEKPINFFYHREFKNIEIGELTVHKIKW